MSKDLGNIRRFLPRFTLTLEDNHAPIVADGVWRRMKIIVWEKKA